MNLNDKLRLRLSQAPGNSVPIRHWDMNPARPVIMTTIRDAVSLIPLCCLHVG
jgi:hypothetical protein